MRKEYEAYAKGFGDRVNGRKLQTGKSRAYRAGWLQGGRVNDPDPRAAIAKGADAKLYLVA